MDLFLLKLISTKQFEIENGRITFFKEPISMVASDCFIQLTKDALEKKGKRFDDLYLAGWIGAYAMGYKMTKEYKLKKFEDRYSLGMKVVSLCGFGDFETLEFEERKFTHFKVMNNPIALAFHPSKIPVDDFLRGINAGGGSLVHEKIMNCVERECAAQNGKFCEFYTASDETLRKADKKFVKSQLNLEYLKKKEKEYLKSLGHKVDKNGNISFES